MSLKQRATTSLFFVIAVLSLVLINDISLCFLLLSIAALVAYEYSKIIAPNSFYKIIIAFTICGMLTALLFLKQGSPYIIIACVLTSITLMLNLFSKKDFIDHKTFFIPLFNFYIIIPCIIAVFYITSGVLDYKLFLGMLILIWVSDAGAYLVGSRIGKTKLFERISPGKTWEGFFGGGMLAMISAYIISSFMNLWDFQQWIIIGLICWILGTIGDLIESKVKRTYKIKDSGTILPGHGGFYDRFDSFIFVLPFILIYFEYFIQA